MISVRTATSLASSVFEGVEHHPNFSYVPPQVSTGPPFAPPAALSFRPLSPRAPHFSPLPNPSGGAAPPSLAYQNPSIPPPGVSSADVMAPVVASAAGGVAVPASVLHMQPMMSYQAPPTSSPPSLPSAPASTAPDLAPSSPPVPCSPPSLLDSSPSTPLRSPSTPTDIFLWQAIGFIGFYAFFVGLVFYMDLGVVDGRGKSGNSSIDLEEQKELVAVHVDSDAKVSGSMNDEKRSSGFPGAYGLIPIATLKLSIPEPVLSQWSRLYSLANIAFCPIALLYACKSFVPFDHPIAFLFPNTDLPLWSVVLTTSFCLACLHLVMEKEPPKTEQIPVVVMAFVMSVFWISTAAGELANGGFIMSASHNSGGPEYDWGIKGDKKDSVTASKTLDLTSGFEVGPTTNGACDAVSCHSARSVLTIAFQFPFDSSLQDNVAVMACQYICSVISSVQRVAMAISPSKLLRSDSLMGESVLKYLWHHQDAILCCSLKSVPVFIFANQVGLDMLETTLVALQDITWCSSASPEPLLDPVLLCTPSATVATPAPPLGRHRVALAIHSSSSIFPFTPLFQFPAPRFPFHLILSGLAHSV
ncbi:Cation/calcium exchanger [Arachis hypogaea]|nr:Cation/calcium exchanger [Arachis hypogaea]